MTAGEGRVRGPRTVLEQRIWERNQSIDEFVRDAEVFARKVGEVGTLSDRHLKRLIAGRKPDGSPVGRPRPATARLLERIFGLSVDELLSPVDVTRTVTDGEQHLRERLNMARRIDASVLSLLRQQLASMRRLDRQLGAVTASDEAIVKIQQVTQMRSYSLASDIRKDLSVLLAELGTLAGWQALDLGDISQAWQHYEQAKAAARESGQPDFEAHTAAEQAFVLIDLGETTAAVRLLAAIDKQARPTTGRLLRSWLAAAHGEALAADGQRSASLRAFDRAAFLLPTDPDGNEGPYVALDDVHLERWRGHALARIGEPEAVDVLTSALNGLDRTFTRAETGLRVDLATAFVAIGEQDEARKHITQAQALATGIGSTRQQRRILHLQN